MVHIGPAGGARVIEVAETREMGHDYIMKLIALLNFRSMILVYIGAIVGGIIGAYIGKVFLKKHFEKAGIIYPITSLKRRFIKPSCISMTSSM